MSSPAFVASRLPLTLGDNVATACLFLAVYSGMES